MLDRRRDALTAMEGLDHRRAARRLDGHAFGGPVSLFILPGLTRPAAELSLFGHDEVVWTQGDRTYMLVARGGFGSDLARVASYLRTEAK